MARPRLVLADEGPATLRALAHNVHDVTGLLVSVGAFVVAKAHQAFAEQGRPAGSWPERRVPRFPGILRDFYEGRPAPTSTNFEGRPALLDRGDLRKSVAARLVADDAVEVGSALPYAAVQQYGGEAETLPISEGFQAWLGEWLATPSGRPWRDQLRWMLLPFWTGKTTSVMVRPRPFVRLLPEDVADLGVLLGVDIFRALPTAAPGLVA